MRDLTPEETALRDERRAQFEDFQAEIPEVLMDLAQGLQLERRALLDEPASHLGIIDALVTVHEVDAQLRGQLLARIGCLVGEVLVNRLDGGWLIDETPDSPHFLRFVVGGFARLSSPALTADPFAVAVAYLDQVEVKDLGALVDAVVSELEAAQP